MTKKLKQKEYIKKLVKEYKGNPSEIAEFILRRIQSPPKGYSNFLKKFSYEVVNNRNVRKFWKNTILNVLDILSKE